MQVEKRDLDLDKVLPSGMAFRWAKSETKWIGVIENTLFVLEQGATEIAIETFPKTDAATQMLESYFDLKFNYALPKNDDNFVKALDVFGSGIRKLCLSPTETLFSFICSANNNIKRISQMVHYLAQKGDLICEYEGKEYFAFPKVEMLQKVTEDELRKANFGYRAKYIVKTVEMIMKNGGSSWIEHVAQLEYEDCIKQLISLNGIGRKVADCIALYSMDKRLAVPLDVHVIRIANRDYSLGAAEKGLSPTAYESIVSKLREIWGPDAGWVQTVLFYKELQNAAQKNVPKKRSKTPKVDEKPKVAKSRKLTQK